MTSPRNNTADWAYANDLSVDWLACGQDLSVPGQRQIRYSSQLQYGNEVFLGCYEDSTSSRHFAFSLPVNNDNSAKMTPQYCMQQCR